ncbi:nitrite/sulfite reductase ferredoxin-like protein [Thermodesulfitimonas autotrophica]|uniref:Nitrite/sulfite reductase ferredoxin-like protein n=1 Tax=Thermodesulfitimonas autotrophica TaxID=1894989 RepID=A0A3N5AAE4_9THEO|nr:nitrite reductase [Thermodesulfitimonas autotrophica]RPF42579.1 nitrite/sulfite reductase ferredoxin-like protein [Thermodesulfitimonas autotrophica]
MVRKYGNKGFIQQLDGTYAVLIHPVNGYLEAEQIEAVYRLAKQYGKAKLTVTEAIMIFGIKPENFDQVAEELEKVHLPLADIGPVVRNVKVCSSQYCKHVIRDVTPLAEQINQRLAGMATPKKFKIALNGCPNSCVEAQLNDLGIIAVQDGYWLYLGGKGGRQPQLGTRLDVVIKEEHLVETVERIAKGYLRVAQNERLAEVINRMGLLPFLKAALAWNGEGIKTCIGARYCKNGVGDVHTMAERIVSAGNLQGNITISGCGNACAVDREAHCNVVILKDRLWVYNSGGTDVVGTDQLPEYLKAKGILK